MADTRENRPRFKPGEVILSPVTEEDLLSLSEGYHAAFPKEWYDKLEPPNLRPTDARIRHQRFATRMIPWLKEPHVLMTKAVLHPSSPSFDPSNPNRVIGHAGWLAPERTRDQILNFWRRDACEKLGWCEKMGWSKEEEAELWAGTNVEAWQENFLQYDRIRADRMREVAEGHWFLAPLWVVPDFQGRGVASLLLKEVIEIADRADPPQAMYLEAMPAARAIYERFGYRGVEGEGHDFVMIRWPKDGDVKGSEPITVIVAGIGEEKGE
ncbi:hypothetical protein K432DRAFT_321022 [Lepidopterella palustris CBS 459.81]|uniref:N-acetyltransferase domain-containing protein n=1 Tax=Lepidopterella palustris CBS 459.81 TaxID=1314670 RepID=A0A8E2EHT5_9PEZI|nr:hypothetical protein K432DRAFT_321022 [Lepidopterella palustris CBS 459.81]